MSRFQWRQFPGVAAAAVAMLLSLGVIGAQTVITPPANRYSVSDDVEIGRQASAQVAQQLPILGDREVTSPIASIGRRLVDAIPPEFQHPEFRYSFDVINVREINAFALPGGPMYINRGMIQAARNEGEAASVMAHELSHVALRHGTAQATKATKYEIGQLAGAVIGAIIGGRAGGAVSQGTQFGLGTAFLRFSREYERQADLLGSHIMARAGYDPRDMASMFKTIEKAGGSGGPEWLSDHPNPGDRSAAVTREAQSLQVQNRMRRSGRVRRRAGAVAPDGAGTDDERGDACRAGWRLTLLACREPRARSRRGALVGLHGVYRREPVSGQRPVELARAAGAATASPSRRTGPTETRTGRASSPTGWRSASSGPRRPTCGPRPTSSSARSPRSNPRLSRPSRYDTVSIAGRQGLHTILSNVSDATGQQERIEVFTTLVGDGGLFYALGVAPRDRFSAYQATFRRVVGSIQLNDRDPSPE